MAVLPWEVFDIVCQHLDTISDVKTFRLVCRYFASTAEACLFSHLDTRYAELNVERVKQLSKHPAICRRLTSLAFDARTVPQPMRGRHSPLDRLDNWYDKRVDVIRRALSQSDSPERDSVISSAATIPGINLQSGSRHKYPARDQDHVVWKAYKTSCRIRTKHGDETYLTSVLQGLSDLFALGSIDTIVVADRGIRTDAAKKTCHPARLFDPIDPEMDHILTTWATGFALEEILDLACQHVAPLRHLTAIGLDWPQLGDGCDGRLPGQALDLFPHLETLRLHINAEDHEQSGEKSMESLLHGLLSSLGPNLTTLKIAFAFDSNAGRNVPPAAAVIFKGLFFENLETLHLKSCEFTATWEVNSLLNRHRRTLKDVVLSDQAFMQRNGMWQDAWMDAFEHLREDAIPLDRFMIMGVLDGRFGNFLVIEGTFTELDPEKIYDWFIEGGRCILVEDNGKKVTYGPEYRVGGDRSGFPEPWVCGGDVFDWRFCEDVDD